MNREDITQMVREAEKFASSFCKSIGDRDCNHWGDAFNERFAALVAAAEREACAKVCDGWMHANGNDCAEAIRARGQETRDEF